MERVDDETLLGAIREHMDSVHPLDPYTDEELRDWMAAAAYTIAESKP